MKILSIATAIMLIAGAAYAENSSQESDGINQSGAIGPGGYGGDGPVRECLRIASCACPTSCTSLRSGYGLPIRSPSASATSSCR
jgi:hypothetical protein